MTSRSNTADSSPIRIKPSRVEQVHVAEHGIPHKGVYGCSFETAVRRSLSLPVAPAMLCDHMLHRG